MARLEYDDEGSGPALLLLHGFPLNRSLWRHQLEHLSGVRRIAPDLRGMGSSPVPPPPYDMADYAADLFDLLDALGLDRVALCGLSMGGYIAFEMLRRAPERVGPLVLMDTTATADTDQARRNRDRTAARAMAEGPPALASELAGKLLGPASLRGEQASATVQRMIATTPAQGMVGALKAMAARPDSTGLLPLLGGRPVLVVVGQYDGVTPPETARSMAESIPGARLEVIPGSGHLPPLEQPEATTKVMARFLEGA